MTVGSDGPDAVFFALADATRRELVARLSAEGPATATELAKVLPMTRQAVRKHLGVLGDAGLVAAERRGRETRWSLTPRPLGEAASWMADVGARWDDRLATLRALLADRR